MSKLNDYMKLREDFRKRIEEGDFEPKEMLIFQELNYRIEVLETLQSFCKTAPITVDTGIIGYHHQLVLAFVKRIASERQLGERSDQEGAKRRETAQHSLEKVVDDCCKRFAAFRAESQGQYQKALGTFINTILPVWLQYRSSYVDVKIPDMESKSVEPSPSASAEESEEDELKKAFAVECPIKKYKGKTLGDVLTLDPRAIKWLATEYDQDASVRKAARTICEYAARKSA